MFGTLYACGGGRDTSVEILDAFQQRWVAAPQRLDFHGETNAVALGKHIYICGGGFNCFMGEVQCLDRSEGVWQTMPPMRHRRFMGFPVVWQKCLHICGGMNGDTPINVIERFNNRNNSWEDLWCLVNPLQGAAVAAYGDHLP